MFMHTYGLWFRYLYRGVLILKWLFWKSWYFLRHWVINGKIRNQWGIQPKFARHKRQIDYLLFKILLFLYFCVYWIQVFLSLYVVVFLCKKKMKYVQFYLYSDFWWQHHHRKTVIISHHHQPSYNVICLFRFPCKFHNNINYWWLAMTI